MYDIDRYYITSWMFPLTLDMKLKTKATGVFCWSEYLQTRPMVPRTSNTYTANRLRKSMVLLHTRR